MTGTARWYGPNARERLGLAHLLATPPTVQTGAYTLAAADAGGTVEIDSATGVSVTVPAGVFTAGQSVTVVQTGAGLLTVAAGAGLTLNSPLTLKAAGQWASVTVRFRSAAAAILSGNLSAT